MKEITKVFTYNKNSQPIRVEMINDEPWFVAKDVCDVLGLTDTSKTVERLDEDEKLMRILFVSGQNRQLWLVNESGLYNLIFASRKPEARAFRKWVTGEVLPAIRRTGGYMAPEYPRYPRRHEAMSIELLQLLWMIGDYLNSGDQKAIALELGVSTVSVNRVIQGKQRSPRILGALYERALRNRGMHNYLYSNPKIGIKKLTE